MSPVQATCRRTIGLARNLYATVFAVGGFLAVSAALFAFNLQAAEGGRLSLSAVWAASVAPVLPALAAFLAMDVWSDERRSGRLDLLLTVAVRERELVLGKFLGVLSLMAASVVFFHLASLGALAFFAPTALRGVRLVSFAPGLLALLVQGVLWCAVSLALSAMTSHGAVAACSALGVLVALPRALWAAFMAWAPTGRPAFGEMPLDAHAIDISSGVISTGTVISYLVLTLVMLFICSKCVSATRLIGRGAARLRFTTAFAVGLSLVFAVLAIFLAMRLDVKVDIPVGGTANVRIATLTRSFRIRFGSSGVAPRGKMG